MTATRNADFTRHGATPLPAQITTQLASLPVYCAESLTAGGNQALIALGDQVYQLRITRAGKLILTK